VLVKAAAADALLRLAVASYPVEGCGVLLGHVRGRPTIVDAIAGRNLVTDRAHDRYELDPLDILAAERRARAEGLDVVGFWHTHPDHPAQPSRFDTERAWPEYVYAICSTTAEGVADVRWWRLQDDGEFAEIAVEDRG
jgi:proteasome lid subunit RPN8/RPN11